MRNTALLVVDVQPAYGKDCQHIAAAVVTRINNTVKPTVVMWVGEGLTEDTEPDVKDYLRSYGARRSALDRCTFVEKDYGFFRPWMDTGVASEVIVKTGREMLRRGATCSEMLPPEELGELLGDKVETLPQSDNIHMPYFDQGRLKLFDAFETCGGGSAECLAEMELWLQVHAKSYRRLSRLVY